MKKEITKLIDVLKKFEGFSIIDFNKEGNWIHFSLNSDENLEFISTVISEIRDQYACSLLVLTNQEEESTYQLVIDAEDKKNCIILLTKKFLALLEARGNVRQAKNRELGLPDLSYMTIKQMATELKSRQNLTFALIWIENNERDNIAIEGSGNPTQLIGLLARGQHMAIEWADKTIKFYRPEKDEE